MERHKKLRKTNEQFISDAMKIHGDEYNYDKCNYINAHTKIIVTCKIHGDFECKPNNHLNGSICKQCSIEKSYNSNEKFIDKVNTIHKNKFTFNNTKYAHSMEPIIITCIKHGDFITTPNRILSGRGCQICSNQKLSLDEFIVKANLVHNNLYDYSYSEYENIHTPVKIICPIHGEFFQTPAVHIHSQSKCPSCSNGGYKRTESGEFYIQELKLYDKIISYKFGITNKNSQKRLYQQSSTSIYDHNLIFSLKSSGEFIFQLEKYIKQKMNIKYILKENMKDGYTETINPNDIDILENIIIDYLINEYDSIRLDKT